ncbi:TIGR04222 domain-containing membrane protein [Actinoplanes sp. NPDC026623]|uniref:TIGR04222 domain-containing membrane protein n=1 Tax=Actinoplanes sp. NPDC026623 TaxID=3155610 RepID=UPI0033FDD41D
MNLAAQGDTWGITGPSFLIIYLGAVVTVAILAAIHRRILFAGNRSSHIERLGPQQIAYLNGGDRLAVYAALGGLRSAGAIAGGSDKTLNQSGPLPADATPLDSAIYNAAGRRIRSRDITGDQWVVAALRQLREGLEAQGLAVPPAQVKTARLWALAGAALVLLGVARLIDGIQNERPVVFLVGAVGIAVLVSISILRNTRRRATRVADKGMTALRTRHDYLSPRQSPSYATYGASGAAMGVALFGTASLYTMDPAFAAEAEVQRTHAFGDAGASSYSSGSSCGTSSSSCGGGGSSCGGGGGCGGGGCGG